MGTVQPVCSGVYIDMLWIAHLLQPMFVTGIGQWSTTRSNGR